MKLYNIRDEIKAKLDAKKPKEAPITSVVDEIVEEKPAETIIEEEEISLVEEEKPLVGKEDVKLAKDIQDPFTKEHLLSKGTLLTENDLMALYNRAIELNKIKVTGSKKIYQFFLV